MKQEDLQKIMFAIKRLSESAPALNEYGLSLNLTAIQELTEVGRNIYEETKGETNDRQKSRL